jgi:hypothetical protein
MGVEPMGYIPHSSLPHNHMLMDTVFLRPSNFRFGCKSSGLEYESIANILWPVHHTACNRSVIQNKNIIHLSTWVNLYDEINMCQGTGTDAVCLSFRRYRIASYHKQTHIHTQRNDTHNISTIKIL